MVCQKNFISRLDYVSYEIGHHLYVFMHLIDALSLLPYPLMLFFSKRTSSVEIVKSDILMTVYFPRAEAVLENVIELQHQLFSYKYIAYDEDRLRFLLNCSYTYQK